MGEENLPSVGQERNVKYVASKTYVASKEYVASLVENYISGLPYSLLPWRKSALWKKIIGKKKNIKLKIVNLV